MIEEVVREALDGFDLRVVSGPRTDLCNREVRDSAGSADNRPITFSVRELINDESMKVACNTGIFDFSFHRASLFSCLRLG